MSSIVVFVAALRVIAFSAAAKICRLASAPSPLRTLLLVCRLVLPCRAGLLDNPGGDSTPASGPASPRTGKSLADVMIFLPDGLFGDLAAGLPGQRFRTQYHIARHLIVGQQLFAVRDYRGLVEALGLGCPRYGRGGSLAEARVGGGDDGNLGDAVETCDGRLQLHRRNVDS